MTKGHSNLKFFTIGIKSKQVALTAYIKTKPGSIKQN